MDPTHRPQTATPRVAKRVRSVGCEVQHTKHGRLRGKGTDQYLKVDAREGISVGHPGSSYCYPGLFFHRAFCLEFQRLHHTCSPPRTALCKPKSPHTAFVSSAELGGADRRTSPWTHWASSAIISFAATGLSVEGLTSLNKPGQMM